MNTPNREWILSTLPSITSTASQLSVYTFVDTLSKGISYKKNDVVLEFYKEASCTNKIATWTADSEKFTVAYSAGANGEGVMTIAMTAAGLNEINTSNAVYTEAGMVNSGYSDCTLRITYAGLVGSNADVILGDSGNPNDVRIPVFVHHQGPLRQIHRGLPLCQANADKAGDRYNPCGTEKHSPG